MVDLFFPEALSSKELKFESILLLILRLQSRQNLFRGNGETTTSSPAPPPALPGPPKYQASGAAFGSPPPSSFLARLISHVNE